MSLDQNADWAWSEYEPSAERPWTLQSAGHLYRRAAWGASWPQLEQALEAGPRAAVDQLLSGAPGAAEFDTSFDQYQAAAARTSGSESLRGWWLRRMLETPHPLQEKMTLFWHGHFGISLTRVQDTGLMARHVGLLRTHALARYDQLLAEILADPAVYLGLSADASRKASPNENLARQLMARFSLGDGSYGQEDVREAARAFTGWFVLRGQLRFFDREYDTGLKTILGQQGPWQGPDVVRIVLAERATPRTLVRKLYRWFVSETQEPDTALLEPLVTRLAADYDIGRLVGTILRSNHFFSPAACRQRIKSPVEFAVGTLRALQATVPTVRLGSDLARLGQDLYHPPTVKGWIGGRHWINTATLIGRQQLAADLLQPDGPYGGKLNPLEALQHDPPLEPEAAARRMIDLLLQGNVAPSVAAALEQQAAQQASSDRDAWLRPWTRQLLTLPEYQLS